MSEPAIRTEGLAKEYRLGELHRATSLREVISAALAHPLGLIRRSATESFWALKDVSFDVRQGEVMGVIGRNGAGKSTLLKVLAKITCPTEGRVELRGRVASLLEVGTGFHPELTGRENIFLNGAILGMRREEIRQKFDDIVAFAEVEKFIDTPVKRYSSGMYVRLAFAVAAHLEPEILLVDEVLAVGDAAFQRKCLGRMDKVAGQGRTVVFVSHNMTAVRALCPRSLLLDRGDLVLDGATEDVVSEYLRRTAADLPSQVSTADVSRPEERLIAGLRIVGVRISASRDVAVLLSTDPLALTLEIEVTRPLSEVVFGWSVHASDRVRLFECRSIDDLGPIDIRRCGRYSLQTQLTNNPLNPGTYELHVGARCAEGGLDYLPGVLAFQVELGSRVNDPWLEARSGLLSLPARWNLSEVRGTA